MSLFVPPRRFDPRVLEIMDRPGNDPALLRADLHVLENINRFFGGYRATLGYVDLFLQVRPTGPLAILDLATGGADVPRAIIQWARGQGVRVEITAVDRNPEILRIAREACVELPEIHLVQHDLLALPYPAGSFDFVLCSLALHHFTEADVVAILRRIHDIARVGYVVSDLRRNRVAIWLSKLMARTIIKNPIARFDAPASCERAFSVAELRAMATQAGVNKPTIHRQQFFRMALVERK
jgi:ubiquinone/menaquinone biosynthesis C-methylase UbiE